MANRTIRTPEKRARFLASLEKSGRIGKSCKATRISRTALHDWRRDEPDLEIDIQRAIAVADEANTEDVEDAFLASAKEGNVTAQIFWLKNHKPDRYKDRTVNEHTGPDGQPLTVLFSPRPDGPA